MHIGVDVGTSGTKACAFDEKGNLTAQAMADYDFSNTKNGRREIDARSFTGAVLDVLTAMAAQLKQRKAGEAKSITISSLGEAVVPLSNTGETLYNFICGSDIRGDTEAHALEAEVGADALAWATGVSPGVLYSYGKIAWLRRHVPVLFEQAALWLNVQDYVVRLLCGEAVMDDSIASRTMMYDINERRWWQPALQALGLTEAQLPKVCPPGSPVGTLRASIAAQTGLSADVVIVVGAHDHITNSLGCGVVRPGWAANSTGTTEGITSVMDHRMSPEEIVRCNISCEPFVVPGKYCTVAWHNAAGLLLKWYRREFGRDDDGGFAGLDAKCPPGPTGLLVLPHFSGSGTPDFDANSKGAVVGLTLDTTRYQLFKALMEGSTYELRRILDTMETCNLRTDELVVCGGGAHSRVWLQMKSDILEKEVRVPTHEQNGALGCSMLGAVACGRFANIEEAVQAMTGSRPAAQPDKENVKRYRELMAEYQQLYPALAPINHAL